MNPLDDPDDELLREYRRASAADTGPSAATRKAILAHARAAALQRRPAANDHRFAWRAVAGVAVLGVAVLVWRQVDRPLAPQAPPMAQAPAKAPEPFAEPETATPPSAAPTRAAAPPPPAAPAPAPPALDARSDAQQALAKARAPQDRGLSANVVRDVASESARQETSAFAVAALSDAQRLQIYFPSAYASATAGTRLWLLEDANGEVIQSGSLAAQETLDTVALRVQQESPGRSLGPWRVVPVSNAQGTPLQLGIARLQ